MKKLLFVAALIAGFSVSTFANESYKINDSKIDQAFTQSQDVTFSNLESTEMLNTITTTSSADVANFGGDEKTKTGFLVRAFFCGWIGLHRTYMGTGGKTLWYYYCIPVYGGVLACGDFWGTIFMKDLFAKYPNNSKNCVWLGDSK